ncbi:MAG: glutathione synthetase, partial [Saprospiraceae bacterium]
MIRNLLIVTDHSTHTASNSIYELGVALNACRINANIWVCSKGIKENKDFFNSITDAAIYATAINSSFAFHPSGMGFSQSTVRIDRKEIDAIIVRMPQPLDKQFLLSLNNIVSSEKIINNPQGTIETSSKEFLITVAHLCPPLSLCQNIDDAIRLSQQMEIVLKPLYSYGGIGIGRLSDEYYWEGDTRYPASEISSRALENQFPMLAMKYLSNVSLGDKRTIVVNKKILGSALRLPAEGSWICNVANGGRAMISETDEDELIIERELTPLLYEKGVIMYGFDTLTDDNGKRVLSEINTLSIGGIGPLSELSGRPILKEAA